MRAAKFLNILIAFSIFMVGCAPSTFLTSKGGRAYAFGRQNKVLFLFPEQKEQLKSAFKEFDYIVTYIPC